MNRVLLSSLILLMLPLTAKSAIIVSFQNASIASNGTGYVDVLISSSNPIEQLTLTSLDFQINGTPALNGSLEFVPDADPGNYSPPNYVFGTATGNYFDTVLVLDKINVGDFYSNGEDSVDITGLTQTLARLTLKHTALGDPNLAVGDTFTVNLDPLGTNQFRFWDDSDPDPGNHGLVDLTIGGTSFTNFATITITSAAVPEPSTCLFLTVTSAAIVGRKWRHRKRPIPNRNP